MFCMCQTRAVFFGSVTALLVIESARGQPIQLPPAPAGVQTFSNQGIQFSRVQAANVQALTVSGNYFAPIGGGTWDFSISRTEITQGQWVEFVNAFGTVPMPSGQPWSQGLSELFQGQGASGPGVFFTQLGPLGRPIYQVTPEGSVIPSSGPGWYGAALYSNWLHNDREVSLDAINAGAYDLSGWNNSAPSTWPGVSREQGARYWIPSYDEWAVASFYDPRRFGEGQPGWWPYLNGRDRLPIPGPPGVGETASGWQPSDPNDPNFFVLSMPVASYPNSQSPWGLLDTSGTRMEFVENNWGPGEYERMRAGTPAGPLLFPESQLRHESPGWIGADTPIYTSNSLRIATSVPSPASGATLVALLALSFRRRRP